MDDQYDSILRRLPRLLWLLLSCCGASLVCAQSPRNDTLRIALVLPARQTNAQGMLSAGVALGLSEATRAAALFGGAVSVVGAIIPTDTSIDAELRALRLRGVSAVIANTSCDTLSLAAQKVGLLFVDAGCAASNDETPRSFTLHLWPSEEERTAAIAHAPADVRAIAQVVIWDSTLERFGADQLNQRFRTASHRGMTSDAWSGWVAMKILWEASLRARSVDPIRLAQTLLSPTSRFDGHKGSVLSFRASDHRLTQPLYLIIEQNGARKVVDVDSCHSATGRACP